VESEMRQHFRVYASRLPLKAMFVGSTKRVFESWPCPWREADRRSIESQMPDAVPARGAISFVGCVQAAKNNYKAIVVNMKATKRRDEKVGIQGTSAAWELSQA
jgi:hypothetical protein